MLTLQWRLTKCGFFLSFLFVLNKMPTFDSILESSLKATKPCRTFISFSKTLTVLAILINRERWASQRGEARLGQLRAEATGWWVGFTLSPPPAIYSPP